MQRSCFKSLNFQVFPFKVNIFRGATLGTDKVGLDLSGLSIILDPLHWSYFKSLCFPNESEYIKWV